MAPTARTGSWKHRFKEQEQLLANADNILRLSTLTEIRSPEDVVTLHRHLGACIQETRQLEDKLAKKLSKKLKNQVPNNGRGIQRQNSIGPFLAWLKENGAKMNGCSIAAFEGYGLGIKLDQTAAKNSLIMSVPSKLFMSTDSAKRSILSNLFDKLDILKNMPNVLLAIHLLVEKFSPNSFWKSYINTLPKTYNTILYFTQLELEELAGSCALEPSYTQIRSIIRQYAYFYKVFATLDDEIGELMHGKFSFKEYCWAVSTVMTRQNLVPLAPNQTFLIPLFDMCNHANGGIITDYNPETDQLECLASKDFQEGEQLFIFYGKRSNSEILGHNGFFYEDNEHDYRLVSMCTAVPKRVELLKSMGMPPSFLIQITKDTKTISDDLLAFTRVMCLPSDQIDQWMPKEKSAALAKPDCPLDAQLTKRCWDYLKIRLTVELAHFKTTIEEDLEILNKPNLSENMKLIVKLRLSEKRLLKSFAAVVEEMSQK
ncbi:actin-histidine N-methyltransferase [Dendroctonus ponderosae]|uniref:actin-histidine N-methyltransferase n=1 Tax=Dendroctonus ponderosae TaxID=77166 RepID=UPI00203531BB|nr:actin-histidine N-methyltransferase [Dendroctonus ponderosae]